MRALCDTKAVSTLMIILLMIISAFVGGVISYMFTIPQFIEMPEGTTLTITGVYFDNRNATAFKVGVLNPSFSPANATVTKIAVSLKEQSQLYDVVETEPSIGNGTVVQKGESLNITCSKVRRDSAEVVWGSFAGEFAGETIIVHVFSKDSPAANIEATLPFVKLHITDTYFDSKVSFRRFNITIVNDANSEINLTVNEIMVPTVVLEGILPGLPCKITKEPVQFAVNGSWHGLIETNLTVSTEEGYIFYEYLKLPRVHTVIQNVVFDEDQTDHFNVTVFNLAVSANYVNITKIKCTLENGAAVENNYSLIGIAPDSSFTFKFDWNWTEYRGKEVDVKAYLLQDFETEPFTVNGSLPKTPQPIIVQVLNKEKVFNLQDRTHFNITLQNHPSSLDAVNITKIVVRETGEVINGTKADPIEPGNATSFYCNITDWNTTLGAGSRLTLTIHTVTNKTSEEHLFEFMFTLPTADLNITSIDTVIGAKYLNMTVENLGYSLWNLTISKVTIKLQNQTEPLEQTFPKNQTIITPSDTAILLCSFDWEKHKGESITVTVFTDEGVEASQTFQIP